MLQLTRIIEYPSKKELPLPEFQMCYDYVPGTKINTSTWCIKRQDTILKKYQTESYGFYYKCPNCLEEVGPVKLFTLKRRISQERKLCLLCANYDLDKRASQKLIRARDKVVIKKEKDKTTAEIIADSEAEFQNETDEFRNAYCSKHITMQDYEKVKRRIVAIQNGKFKCLDRFQYLPFVKVNNSVKYIPRMLDTMTDKFEKLEYVTWKCQICENVFTNRDWHIQKPNVDKGILCHDCSFCNRIFKPRLAKTFFGASIRFQSNPEKGMIDFCNANHIVIENGPVLEYFWNKKTRRYFVDFCLPEFGIWLEIKDYHHWHRENLANGKWQAKENVASRCLPEGYRFELVYVSQIPEFKESLLRYSLTS